MQAFQITEISITVQLINLTTSQDLLLTLRKKLCFTIQKSNQFEQVVHQIFPKISTCMCTYDMMTNLSIMGQALTKGDNYFDLIISIFAK